MDCNKRWVFLPQSLKNKDPLNPQPTLNQMLAHHLKTKSPMCCESKGCNGDPRAKCTIQLLCTGCVVNLALGVEWLSVLPKSPPLEMPLTMEENGGKKRYCLLPALILWTMVTLEMISLQEGFVFLHGFPNIEGFSVHHQTGGF